MFFCVVGPQASQELGTGGPGEAPRDGEDVAGWGFLSWNGLGPARTVVGPRQVWEFSSKINYNGQDWSLRSQSGAMRASKERVGEELCKKTNLGSLG